MRLLLVEDDIQLANGMASRLATHGFVIDHAASGEAALEQHDPDNIAALIVDVGLPGMSGVDLVKHWRDLGRSTPILMLTARGGWQEKVSGLDAGADDYVVKPVRSEEVVARLRALLRRAAGHLSSRLAAGDITLDPAQRTAWKGDEQLDLTSTEYRLLRLFLLMPDKTHTPAAILDHLYPADKERGLNAVEVHVGRLRRKIGHDRIKTIRGLGYRMIH